MPTGFDEAFRCTKELVANHCDRLGCQIDAPVYGLYVLTPAEIKIVEGKT
jgi:hypothetical protein